MTRTRYHHKLAHLSKKVTVVLHALHKHFNLFLYNFTATHPIHDPRTTYKTLVLATGGRA